MATRSSRLQHRRLGGNRDLFRRRAHFQRDIECQRLRDGQVDVDANQVHECEWAHGISGRLNRPIDLFAKFDDDRRIPGGQYPVLRHARRPPSTHFYSN